MAGGWAEYVISPDGSTIRIAHPDETPLLEVMRCLAGVSLGAALRFKNVLVLHASTVSVNGAALAFAAPPGAGKSTLSAAFHQRGYSLISEDVVALDEREDGYTVRPGYAGVRLYPEALEYLYGPAVAAEALPVDQKRLHRLDAIPEAPCPLRAVYVLAPRNPDLRAPRITPLSKMQALLVLPGHLYLSRFGPREWLARDFPRLGAFAERVPVYTLERPDNLSDLDATIDLILEHQGAMVPNDRTPPHPPTPSPGHIQSGEGKRGDSQGYIAVQPQ